MSRLFELVTPLFLPFSLWFGGNSLKYESETQWGIQFTAIATMPDLYAFLGIQILVTQTVIQTHWNHRACNFGCFRINIIHSIKHQNILNLGMMSPGNLITYVKIDVSRANPNSTCCGLCSLTNQVRRYPGTQ